MPSPQPSDETLQALQSENGQSGAPQTPGSAFIAQITSHQRPLYLFIYSLLRRASDAEDVLQETNLVLWEKSQDFTLGTDFKAWAFRVAHFQVLAYRKKVARRREHFDDELIALMVDEEIESAESTDIRHRALKQCVCKLRPEHRQLLAARYQPDASVNEIAIRIGRTPKAVSEVLRRLRKNLHDCIEKQVSEWETA